ncbi:tRNA nucleotidyltransferase [Mycena indigotica]|uniref:tRNA nucleotidyltransferase n=1 Tax=Mycena indigotica TaxID=2126181 RepID=A0A8H6W851_9AGAR|nr:tRNA nucleotidyltransferase [Mycena indigotica]KAF7306511.1 tRNA nucleotidyltransferase [Mycena indigotica]
MLLTRGPVKRVLLRAMSRQLSVQSEIKLTEVENKLCTLLDECCTHLRESHGVTTSCRIAGGWVRDKLLGMESDDIDIALSDMMGDVFASHLREFAQTKNVEAGEIAVLNPNPEQSKHLQTARLPIFGIVVDLVNLRSEEYAADSRIPTSIAFGTPVQDALRRDITINALFYNIHSREVEDCTEKGIPDLKNGFIRTPLPPRQTFLDDPLRILRSIRFASRFGFEIDPELANCVREEEIQDALKTKITRDRVGVEIEKMMKGPDPVRAIELIHDMSLYDPIFNVLPVEALKTLSAPLAPANFSVKAARIIRKLITPSSELSAIHPSIRSSVENNPSALARLYLAAALTPFAGITYLDRKKKPQSILPCSLEQSLRLGGQHHFLDGIPLLFAAAEKLKSPELTRWKEPSERVALGLFLREKMIHHSPADERWQLATLFSLAQELVPHYNLDDDKFDTEQVAALIELYNTFASRIEELKLEDVGELKHIITGNDVFKALGATKQGPWTGKALAKVLEWQLDHPNGTPDDCVVWLQQEQAAGRISVTSSGSDERAPKRLKTTQ